jgi:hypothetical protein
MHFKNMFKFKLLCIISLYNGLTIRYNTFISLFVSGFDLRKHPIRIRIRFENTITDMEMALSDPFPTLLLINRNGRGIRH